MTRWHGARAVAAAAAVAALAVLGFAGAASADSSSPSLDWSPYFMLSDPVPANPAAFPWRVVTLSVGPLSGQVDSSAWTAGEVAKVVAALASGGDLSDALKDLPTVELEQLRWATGGRVTVGIAAVQLGYGLVTAGSATLPRGALELWSDAQDDKIDGGDYDLDGTRLVAAAWWDGFVRVNAPVPFLPRLLGIEGFSAGAGVHWLRGAGYFTLSGSGTFGGTPDGAGLTARKSSQGSGTAFEVGAVARLNRFVSVEGAYLGNGRVTWESVQEFKVQEGDTSPVVSGWQPSNEAETLTLPDVALVGLHLRPLASGLLELSGYYSRIGLNQPQSIDRLQAEASVDALGILRATVGTARESTDRQWRLYASVGLGLGATGITFRAVNLQEVFKGQEAKSLGVSLTAGLGF